MRMIYDVMERIGSAPQSTKDTLTSGVRDYLIAYTEAEPNVAMARGAKDIYHDVVYAVTVGLAANSVEAFTNAIMPEVTLTEEADVGTNGFTSVVSGEFYHEHCDIPPGELAMIAKFEHELGNKVGLVGSIMSIMPGTPVLSFGESLDTAVMVCVG